MKTNHAQHNGLNGKVAVISGSTGGMGLAICSMLASKGMGIVMLGRDEGKLQRAKEQVSRHLYADVPLLTKVVDISEPASVERAVEEIYQRTPKVDLLVHAAGDGPVASLLATTESMWHETVNTKLLGTIRLTKSVAQRMVQVGSGQVVIVNGVFSLEPDPMFPVNSTVNCGLAGFAKSAARDLGRDGVRVNVVNPGATQTPLWNDIANELAQRFVTSIEEINAQVLAKIPLGRLATPEDVAGVVAFLASPDSDYLNGSTITVDGGVTAAL